MRRVDLTGEQAIERQTLVARLAAAGWDPRGWEMLFESGANLTPEAQLEFVNERSFLRIGYYAGERYVWLECVDRQDKSRAAARFYVGDGLEPVLEHIVSAQGVLSVLTFADLIEAALPISERVLLETGAGLAEVSKSRHGNGSVAV